MKKSLFGLALCALLVVLCDPTHAQQAKIFKFGWLGVRPASAAFAVESFRREFRELGYVDGKNIVSSIATPRASSTDSLPWPMSWSVLKLT